MDKKCQKCGHIIDGNSPICMHCGATLSDADISQETKTRMATESNKKTSNPNASIKAFGAMLVIAGIVADVFGMIMIFSGEFGGFGPITIFGTIAFLIGIAIISNS